MYTANAARADLAAKIDYLFPKALKEIDHGIQDAVTRCQNSYTFIPFHGLSVSQLSRLNEVLLHNGYKVSPDIKTRNWIISWA